MQSKNVLLSYGRALFCAALLTSSAWAGVTVTLPQNGSTQATTKVQFVASGTSSSGTVTQMKILVDGAVAYQTTGTKINTALKLTPGAHYITIREWISIGKTASSSLNINVASSSGSGGGSGSATTSASCGSMSLGQEAALNGFVPFGTSSPWNQRVDTANVDPNSATLLAGVGTHPVHADFGAGQYNGSNIGIPYTVVSGGPMVNVTTQYYSESDPGPMPIALNSPIEGAPNPTGDAHVLVVDAKNCWLYELYSAQPNGSSWNAGSSAIWDLTKPTVRPYTWTSADAAGLPIFPGLARYDEVAGGQINHALRFTLPHTRQAFVSPATHWASYNTSASLLPMGARLRLKAGFDISKFSPANQVILTALKKYGMILADNGSSMYISGTNDNRWNNTDLHALSTLNTSDFDVVQMPSVITTSNVPSGASPQLSGVTASSTNIAIGSSATLSWNATNAEYVIVSPQGGPVRGNSATVKPTTNTTYTIYATNQYGRTQQSITINVH